MTSEKKGYLLDTHTLLWWLFDSPKLSKTARDIIRNPENRILVSSASGWEMATKRRLGKLQGASEVLPDLPGLLRKARIQTLDIQLEHALKAGFLPGPHRDPFDRMIVAQGHMEGLPVVTDDAAFEAYTAYVQVVW
jgi:PIN domain nuclease of toxin-antitoxin system